MPFFPLLDVHGDSGLTFPWTEFVSKRGNVATLNTGHAGVNATMDIIIRYDDLEDAIKEILGYSERVAAGDSFVLSRKVPFKHQRFPQLWCTRITRATGLKFSGKTIRNIGPHVGTFAKHDYVMLSLLFTRPQYSVLSDDDIVVNGERREWMRYLDRVWKPNVEILTREGSTFKFKLNPNFDPAGTLPMPEGTEFQGALGQRLPRLRLSRKWHQLPVNAVYDSNGFPKALVYDPDNFNNPDPTVDAPGIRLGSVNSQVFLGHPIGTLLYAGVEIAPRQLPMPQNLMNLGFGESVYEQLDVTFHLDYFDPPRGKLKDTNQFITQRGHNLMPWSGDGRWYPVLTKGYDDADDDFLMPPFFEFDFRDLFTIL